MSGHTPGQSLLSKIYAEAAAWLEKNPDSDPDAAVSRAASWRSFKTLVVAKHTFRDSFGCWSGNDDGVLALCFASAMAGTGDL